MIKSLKNENGRSMIEMLGVLAIIGVLSVGGIAGYSKAMQKYRINKAIEQITLMSQNIRIFFANQKNYTGLTNNNENGRKLIKKAKLVPDEVWNADGLVNPFGGEYEIAEDGYEGSIFDIRIRDLPEEACIELALIDWSSVSSGIINIGVGPGADTIVGYDCYTTKQADTETTGERYLCVYEESFPMSMDEVLDGCVCPNNNCQIFLSYR